MFCRRQRNCQVCPGVIVQGCVKEKVNGKAVSSTGRRNDGDVAKWAHLRKTHSSTKFYHAPIEETLPLLCLMS